MNIFFSKMLFVMFAIISTTCELSADESKGNSKLSSKKYGKELKQVRKLGLGRCADATVSGKILYVIGRSRMTTYDISKPSTPQKLGSIKGLGTVRQIEIFDDVAYITSRSDGMFLVDVKDPKKPKLLSHYDTVEMATGIWVTGNVALVAIRCYGVELVDITDLRNPLHLSTVRTGEAQSVVARDGIAYVGVWATQELVICDIKNPRVPSIISKTKMDGNGDGVWVRGKYCFVATGHHQPGVNEKDKSDPRHGMGHGLEIFDITNPADPEFVSRIKAPKLYRLGMDMWDVTIAGNYAYLSDTHNGFFIVDISKPEKPEFVAHKQLPHVSQKNARSAVSGFAVTKDYVYLAGVWTDLHVIAAPGLAKPIEAIPDVPPHIPLAINTKLPGFRTYKPDGQVYAVAFAGDIAYVAAGRSGIHVVQIWPEIKKIAQYTTKGFAADIKIRDNKVYVTESKDGLTIWQRGSDNLLSLLGRYCPKGAAFKQVVVPDKSNYVMIESQAAFLEIVDVSSPSSPERVLMDKRLGILYGYQIADGLFEGRYACCFWHVTGFHWFDLLGKDKPVYSGNNYRERIGASNGMAILPNGKEAICTMRDGQYFILSREEKRSLKQLPKYGVRGKRLRGGKPSIYGNTLYVSNRFWGTVNVLDIADVKSPKLLNSYDLDGNPGIIVEKNNSIIIPAGYQGLLISDEK